MSSLNYAINRIAILNNFYCSDEILLQEPRLFKKIFKAGRIKKSMGWKDWSLLKRGICIGLCIILLVSLIWVIYNILSVNIKCNPITAGGSGAACFEDIARKGGKPSVCKWLIFLEKEDCYYTFAATTNDASICGLIKNEEISGYCYYMNAKGNASVCQKIKAEGWKNHCLAAVTNDSYYCSITQNDTMRIFCYETLRLRNEISF